MWLSRGSSTCMPRVTLEAKPHPWHWPIGPVRSRCTVIPPHREFIAPVRPGYQWVFTVGDRIRH